MKYLKKSYKIIGSMKFAVISICTFAACMVIGTFVESYFGTEYAQKIIYLSWWFKLLQFLLFLSILFATLNRLPFKKRLTGFYIIHLGLMTLFIGAFTTHLAGIDGSITLFPGEHTNRVDLDQSVIKVYDVRSQLSKFFKLPSSSSSTNLNLEYKNFKFKRYLPFSDLKTAWVKWTKEVPINYYSISFKLNSLFMNQDITLVNNYNTPYFSSSINLGPLSIKLIDDNFFNCLKSSSSSKSTTNLLIELRDERKCVNINQLKYTRHISAMKNEVFDIDYKGKIYHFYPEFNSLPISNHMTLEENSPLKIISIPSKNIVYLNKTNAVFFKKGKFKFSSFKNKKLSLPWMGIYFTLKQFSTSLKPVKKPVYSLPRQQRNELIKGKFKAVSYTFNDEVHYVNNSMPQENGNFVVSIEKQSILLPFDFMLSFFQMNTNPGTNQPASYESFVQVFEDGNISKEHIYMNNPLKKDHFTFYQSSYFDMQNGGDTASVLSVNYDPGRFLKYLGSILLVIGAILHFIVFQKRSK